MTKEKPLKAGDSKRSRKGNKRVRNGKRRFKAEWLSGRWKVFLGKDRPPDRLHELENKLYKQRIPLSGKYFSDNAGWEFGEAISAVFVDNLRDDIATSRYLSLSVDDSADITRNEQCAMARLKSVIDVRWISVSGVLYRFIDEYDALLHYYCDQVQKGSENAGEIYEALVDCDVILGAHGMQALLHELDIASKMFQQDSLHLKDVAGIIQTAKDRIIKATYLVDRPTYGNVFQAVLGQDLARADDREASSGSEPLDLDEGDDAAEPPCSAVMHPCRATASKGKQGKAVVPRVYFEEVPQDVEGELAVELTSDGQA
eukprot:jgi/Mesvir1/3917/Mv19859-RA.1